MHTYIKKKWSLLQEPSKPDEIAFIGFLEHWFKNINLIIVAQIQQGFLLYI